MFRRTCVPTLAKAAGSKGLTWCSGVASDAGVRDLPHLSNDPSAVRAGFSCLEAGARSRNRMIRASVPCRSGTSGVRNSRPRRAGPETWFLPCSRSVDASVESVSSGLAANCFKSSRSSSVISNSSSKPPLPDERSGQLPCGSRRRAPSTCPRRAVPRVPRSPCEGMRRERRLLRSARRRDRAPHEVNGFRILAMPEINEPGARRDAAVAVGVFEGAVVHGGVSCRRLRLQGAEASPAHGQDEDRSRRVTRGSRRRTRLAAPGRRKIGHRIPLEGMVRFLLKQKKAGVIASKPLKNTVLVATV